MVNHPDDEQLDKLVKKVHDDNWRCTQLDYILSTLPDYLSNPKQVFRATFVLNECFNDLMGQGRFTELIRLYNLAIDTFMDDPPIPDTRDYFDYSLHGKSNRERFSDIFFTLKLRLAHAKLMRHSLQEAGDLLLEIKTFLPDASHENKLKAYYLFLKYNSYGREIDFEINLVKEIQQLAKLQPGLKLDALIALGYHYYNQSNKREMESTMRRIHRELVLKHPIQPVQISKVTAEQYLYIAVIYRDLKDYAKALDNLEIASKQAAKINNYVQNMLILVEKALLFSQAGKYESAMQWVDLAEAEFHKLPERQDYHQAMIDHTRGVIWFHQKEYDKALTRFQRVLPIWQSYEHTYHIALANNDVGATLIELNRLDDARDFLERAKKLCMPLHDRTYARNLLITINENLKKLDL